MSASADCSPLVTAESMVRSGIPGARVARIPTGLMIVLPVLWSADDLVCLSLKVAQGRLRLVADGGILAGLKASGHSLDGLLRSSLLGHGLRQDAGSGEIGCEIEGLGVLVERAMAMGTALAEIARSEREPERLAA